VGRSSSVTDIYFGDDVIPLSTKIKNLDLIIQKHFKIGIVDIETIPLEEVSEKEGPSPKRLKQFLWMPALQSEYDIIIGITPPSREMLQGCRIKKTKANHMLIPQMERIFDRGYIWNVTIVNHKDIYDRSEEFPLELDWDSGQSVLEMLIYTRNFMRQEMVYCGVQSTIFYFFKFQRTFYAEVIMTKRKSIGIFDFT